MKTLATVVVLLVALTVAETAEPAPRYDLKDVDGISAFAGSKAAERILAQNGFVVSDPYFKQIFEPYLGGGLPFFITTDSAWHTYHVLLEEGVQQLEQVQSERLHEFSKRLIQAIGNKMAAGRPNTLALTSYASVGLAVQDPEFRESLSGAERDVVKTLQSGGGQVQPSIGFPLAANCFSPASFYSDSPELEQYFTARQWYSSVVFRLSDERETRLALELTALINSDTTLSNLWVNLSAPLDSLLGPAEDGDVRSYSLAARELMDSDGTAGLDTMQLRRIMASLDERLPEPQINDQLLDPDAYSDYPARIKGFRLLPPRRLPCALTFHQTTDPAVPGRAFPSGLDFFVSSPTLRSPAAVAALKKQSGESALVAAMNFNCEPFADSLHGDAMKLLASLQKPLPQDAAPAFRTSAWGDKQLWTQLGAWAEQRHTWALHAKLSVLYLGTIVRPAGVVSPYPDFFSGLARLSKGTAEELERAGLAIPFNAQDAARELDRQVTLWQRYKAEKQDGSLRPEQLQEREAELLQVSRFLDRYYEKLDINLEGTDPIAETLTQLAAIAHRCLSGSATETDLEALREFWQSRDYAPDLLRDFAVVCDKLSELASKHLTKETLSEPDEWWIKNYGATLARFHFYEGNSYLEPRDDFPMVTQVFSSPVTGSSLYAGLARPRAIYVILPDAGEGKPRLYQGAVMSYREFVDDSVALSDQAWRKRVSQGQGVPPPNFTQSFHALATADELLSVLQRALPRSDLSRRRDPTESAELLSALAQHEHLAEILDLIPRALERDNDALANWLAAAVANVATPDDIPKLLDLLEARKPPEWMARDDVAQKVAECISRFEWEPYQPRLIEMVSHPAPNTANAAAGILIQHPDVLDTKALVAAFADQPPNARRLSCMLFSVASARPEAREALLTATTDVDDAVRWQALLAIYKAGLTDEESLAAILRRLRDANSFVAGAAAYVLSKLHGATAAQPLLDELRRRRQGAPISGEEIRQQAERINGSHPLSRSTILRVDDVRAFPSLGSQGAREAFMAITRPRNMRRMYSPPPFLFECAAMDALARLNWQPAVEELKHQLGGAYSEAAVRALSQLDAEALETAIFTMALDSNQDVAVRAQALTTISDLPVTHRARELLPLLDETTVAVPIPRDASLNWRVCDQAAVAMAHLLEWETELDGLDLFRRPDQREALIQKLRQWARASGC